MDEKDKPFEETGDALPSGEPVDASKIAEKEDKDEPDEDTDKA